MRDEAIRIGNAEILAFEGLLVSTASRPSGSKRKRNSP
jgi:hypothetical protein